MSGSEKKIAWISSSAFLDTDYYIVPLLMRRMEIDWYVLKQESETTDYDKEIQALISHEARIHIVNVCKKSYSLKRFQQYKNLLNEIRSNYNNYYIEMFGMPFFVPMAYMYLGKSKTIMAIHNVHVPKGGINYNIAKVYRDITIKLFKNYQTFSKSQMNVLLKKREDAKVHFIPFIPKDYGKPKEKIKGKELSFLSFGNIRPYKRIDVLIDAAQQAYDETHIPFYVIIAGQCNDWSAYEKKIRYPELFDLRLHRIKNEDIPGLFAESDYFVAPYQDIAQSGSAIVAINYEKPIIASRLEAFEEYINNGENGFLISPADTNELKTVIINILQNNDMIYEDLVINIKKTKCDYFNQESIIKKYINMFEEIR